MRAPVYRHLDADSTVLGLKLETLLVLLGVGFWVIHFVEGLPSVGILLLAYGLLRWLGRGRPARYWAHRIVFAFRQRLYAGRLRAVGPARIPHLPVGPYLYRDRG